MLKWRFESRTSGQETTGVELVQWIKQFGRWNVQEFVANSRDLADVFAYLKAERSLELAKFMPFVTEDSISFKKRTSLSSVGEESESDGGLIRNRK